MHIESADGIDNILKRGFLSTKFKESGLEIFGIVLDADDDPLARWTSLRDLCGSAFPNLPLELPAGGLIAEHPFMPRFGFWMMPDCVSRGMLENFLRHLVPASADTLWDHATASFAGARDLGASCRDVHTDKARIHTWLAWQDPPGLPFGTALTRKILDPAATAAAPFVSWFRDLYKL